jgi:hypothetical protein
MRLGPLDDRRGAGGTEATKKSRAMQPQQPPVRPVALRPHFVHDIVLARAELRLGRIMFILDSARGNRIGSRGSGRTSNDVGVGTAHETAS